MELQGTSALITGAASGLGAASARTLAARGVHVVVADLQVDEGQKIAQEIGGVFVRTDVTNTADIVSAVEAAQEQAPLRFAINCAGVGLAMRTIGRDGSFESAHDLDAYRRIISINLIGTFDVTRLAATAMSRNEPDHDGCRGAIVNTASAAAFDGQVGQAAYSSSKAGIVGMTLAIARDLAPVGIRVNTIVPGLFETPIYGSGVASDDLKARLATDVLFPKRFGRPEEFASMALELLTNAYMNAETVRLDGGIRMPPKSSK